jgi:hypothetical protein
MVEEACMYDESCQDTNMEDDDTCPGCGIELSEDDAAFFKETGFYECPACLYEGCDKCMPGGRNVLCPDCEGEL